MTLHFQHALDHSQQPWRPSNHWKPRPLTTSSRTRFHAAVKVEMEVGVVAALGTGRSLGKAGGGEERGGKGSVKVAIQPNVLSFGQNGEERLRVQRVHSAGQQHGGGWRAGRAAGSPYLQEQHLSDTAHNHSPQRRHSRQEGSRKHATQHHQQHRNSDEPAERIGRCQPGAAVPQLYKAALALMQAQRQRTTLVQTPSPRPTHHHHHNPHDYYHSQHQHHSYIMHFPSRRHVDSFGYGRHQPKSILRQTPVPPPHGTSGSTQRPYSAQSCQSLHDPRGPSSNAGGHCPSHAGRKKVTFGRDVVVQLPEHGTPTGRVVDHVD